MRTPLLLLIVLLLSSSSAFATEPRRPGLGGAMSTRSLTAPKNSLSVFFGPGQTPLFGQRYHGGVIDAGVAYHRRGLNGSGGEASNNELWARAGVAFGLGERFEAGALFLSFRIVDDFAYADFPVYLTYAWEFDNVDIGARLSFTPAPETKIWAFNPAMPILIRLGKSRIDTGLHLPFALGDDASFGVNLPFRFTRNLTPQFFIAADTGFALTNFASNGIASIPLGFLAGFTTLMGAQVVDITASFHFDDLIVPTGSPLDIFQPGAFRALAGVSFHKLVM